jgi:glycosyltransferase involved in cell wall biosynthesis
MKKRRRVLLLIPHLGGGGAEQVTEILATNLSPEKYEVHLGLVSRAVYDEGRLPEWVTVHCLASRRVRGAAFKLVKLIWQLRPAVILSGMVHLNLLVLMLRLFFPPRTSVLVRQNATVSSALNFGSLPGYTGLLYRIFYRRADFIICQSEAMAADLCATICMPHAKVAVLLNPVDLDGIRAAVANAPNQWSWIGPNLLAFGRLSSEKGFDLLLEAFAALLAEYPGASLTIAGEGACRADLGAQAAALGIEAKVRFLGHIDSPACYFPGASLLVVSSRHEGMPNAMLEAAAAGLPIVSMPASQGMVDLLQDHPGIWVAGDISAHALYSALGTALKTLKPGERFAHEWINQFRAGVAIKAYEDLIDTTMDGCAP